jgi:hypothetical protein
MYKKQQKKTKTSGLYNNNNNNNIHFRLSLWLIIDVYYVLRLLHRVVVDNVADISEVHAASIFRDGHVDSGSIAHIYTVLQPKKRINININSFCNLILQLSSFRLYFSMKQCVARIFDCHNIGN